MTKYEMNQKRSINGSPIQRQWTFSEEMLTSSQMNGDLDERDKLRTFMRTTFHYKFAMLNPQGSLEVLADDIKRVAELMFIETSKPLNTLKGTIQNQRSQLLTFGPAVVERQRIHAEQKTDSCELKSLTVAACYLMNYEPAHQTLIGALILHTIAAAKSSASGASQKRTLPLPLEREIEEVRTRLQISLIPVDQPY